MCVDKFQRNEGKRSFIALFFFVCLFVFYPFLQAQSLKIGVISDMHYMAPSLLIQDGTAFEKVMHANRKLLKESPAILKTAVDDLLNDSVNIVLVTGDLTKDGELISHKEVAEVLQPLLDRGIKVLVVPGNHDINNPFARSFDGSILKGVPTVSADEFRTIYSQYGFETAISTDSSSLSYVSEPVEGLRVICIDDCEYYKNTFKSKGDTSNSCVTGGDIKPATMQWILQQIRDAKMQGKQVLGMMHHNVVEHFDYEGSMPGYMVTDSKNVEKQLMDAGLNVLFTGHFHASDIARANDKNGNFLYDIETGSTVTYPCPYRLIRLSEDSLQIETKYIEHPNIILPAGMDFQTYAHQELTKKLSVLVNDMVNQSYKNIASSIPQSLSLFVKVPDKQAILDMASIHLIPDATNLALSHYCGNENLMENATSKRDNMLKDIDDLVSDVAKESSGLFASAIENYIENRSEMKCLKDIVNSIWNDRVEPDYPVRDDELQDHEPVNDLNLLIVLPKVEVLGQK
ncbi:MAG: metallophosphoesterase [Bacteroidales bacterium]|nr:metallophosphoesterase [Bacteroidales bacterium]